MIALGASLSPVPTHGTLNLTVLAQWSDRNARAHARSNSGVHIFNYICRSQTSLSGDPARHGSRGQVNHISCWFRKRTSPEDAVTTEESWMRSFIVRRSMESARKSSRRRAARAAPASWLQRCCGIGGVGDRGIELRKGARACSPSQWQCPGGALFFFRHTCTQVQAYSRKSYVECCDVLQNIAEHTKLLVLTNIPGVSFSGPHGKVASVSALVSVRLLALSA